MKPHLILAAVVVAAFLTPGVLATAGQSAPSDAPKTTPSATPTHARGLLREPRFIDEGLEFAGRALSSGDVGTVRSGFYPELGNMVTGAGWLSAGPGYRHWFFADRAFVDASAAISWRAYKMAQARCELTRLAGNRLVLGSQVRWQDLTQVTYFGDGSESLETDRSEYRMKSLNAAGYATLQPRPTLAISGSFGWIAGPEMLQPAGAFSRDNAGTHDVFPADPVYRLEHQPDYVYGEVALAVDTRDARGYPTRGGVYRVSWTRYSDRDANTFSFHRYEGEAAHFLPLVRDNLVVALHGWLVETKADPGQHVPFYLAPSLGGANTLRGYSNYRFHDRNFAVVNAETRVAIFEHIDAAIFVDAGNVAARFEDLNLEKTSYGFGVRVHSLKSTVARLDIARGAEGWQALFRVNDPFRLARMSKRTAPIPFAP